MQADYRDGEQATPLPRAEAVRIVGIRFAGYRPVRDLEIAGDHNFVVNGIVAANCQDMNREFLPVIEETMSASKYGITQYSGTPKTFDNTLTKLWQLSSQAEWFIPCTHCTTGGRETWNIPSSEYHLEKMIGPLRPDISHERPAVVCHKCGGFIRPQDGRWVHRYPARAGVNAAATTFEGRHVPQVIMPMHYGDTKKWARLLTKRASLATNVFYNEVLGEPYDTAAKLVTETELIAASNLGPNSLQRAESFRGRGFRYTVLAIDWGGGGEEGLSLTAIAFMGLNSSGRIECHYGTRLLTPHDHLLEAEQVLDLYRRLRPSFVAHDYTGAGALRETFLLQSGVLPPRVIFPVSYIGSAKRRMCLPMPPTPDHPRLRYHVDKSRSLLTTCAAIKCQWLRFFDWDYKTMEDPGLISDFTSLIEEKTQTMAAGELYRIDKADGVSDDFAQAVNIGAVCLWHQADAWPNIALMRSAMTRAQQDAAEPRKPWSEKDLQPAAQVADDD